MLKRVLFTWFLVTTLLLGFSSPAHADANFYTKLTSTYTVSPTGVTTVEHHFKITNKTPTLFIKQYALKLTSSNTIERVSAKTGTQVLTPNVVNDKNLTSIALSFPDQVVGENKSREFTISYQNQDTALISGQVLEVHIPQLSSDQLYDEYQVELNTPIQFGQPVRVNPANHTITTTGSYIKTVFPDVKDHAISTFFGSQQFFELSLRYNLENTSSSQALAQIALPPDTLYQRVQYQNLEPRPDRVELDSDGNWIATYQLAPNTQSLVSATVQVLVSLEPLQTTVSVPPTGLASNQEYWESTDSQIVSLAQQHSTPQAMYDYAAHTLKYAIINPAQPPPRLGAVGALAAPTQATCQEFTDVFVALARAQGLPARRLTGYAYTQNSSLRPVSLAEDVLHAWPEYYDESRQLWIPVDPTWGSTTGGVDYFNQFDLNHIVFAINGQSSSLPYPAGSYKLENRTSKDVDVRFINQLSEVRPDLETSLTPWYFLGLPIPGFYELEINNRTGRAWYDIEAEVSPRQSAVQSSVTAFHLDELLPFAQHHRLIRLIDTRAEWPVKRSLDILLKLPTDNNTQLQTTHDIIASPFYFTPFALLALGASGIGFTLVAGSLLVYRRR